MSTAELSEDCLQTQATPAVISHLGFDAEMAWLKRVIHDWINSNPADWHDALNWQFGDGSKYFRPSTVFACHIAIDASPIPESVIRSALVIEMYHNVSLIVDDILDQSDYRRAKLTLHKRFGEAKALMVSGHISAEGFRLVRDDPQLVRLFAELMRRLAAAECMQWRLRQQAAGVEVWRQIAGEDTGSMFEICACLGDRSERLRRFGHLLGVLYHGCDDVGDVRGGEALGGGGNEDIRDGILTLPASIAVRDPQVAKHFSAPSPANYEQLEHALRNSLPEAESYLDQIAEEARQEARKHAHDPEPLLQLIDQTRGLSTA